MIEDVFLTYANNSLQETPNHLLGFFEAVQENIEIDLEDAIKVVPVIVDLTSAENGDLNLNSRYLKRRSYNQEHANYDWRLDLAIGSIESHRERYFGPKRLSMDNRLDPRSRKRWEEELQQYREWVAREGCEFRALRCEHEGEDNCLDSHKWKCYECLQIGFTSLLSAIVQGYEYTKIRGFDEFLVLASETSIRRTEYVIQNSVQGNFKKGLLGTDLLSLSFSEFKHRDIPSTNTFDPFGLFVRCLASYSLAEFLRYNDRRRLKQCPFCHEFFVAEDIRRQRCKSPACEREYQRQKKRLQRENEPEIYT
jgi:hypothetical protein